MSEPTELTAEQMDAIRARHEAATLGIHLDPVRYDHGGGRLRSSYTPAGSHEHRLGLVLDVYEEGDREFYFNSHTDTSALLSHADALQAKVARLEGELKLATSTKK